MLFSLLGEEGISMPSSPSNIMQTPPPPGEDASSTPPPPGDEQRSLVEGTTSTPSRQGREDVRVTPPPWSPPLTLEEIRKRNNVKSNVLSTKVTCRFCGSVVSKNICKET